MGCDTIGGAAAGRSGEYSSHDRKRWRAELPDLLRMALDPGLLRGWPGEASSWAPYHALHVLGRVRAHECAAALFPLLDQEDDWLSDRLAVVWPQMGPPAEPPLWGYLADPAHGADQRGVVALALGNMATAHPHRRDEIVSRLAQLLAASPAAEATANAFVVEILSRLNAVEQAEIIREAFAQNRVDPTYVQPHDVDFL